MAKGKYQEWVTPDNLLLIKGWARDGLNDKEIMDKIGISKQTFYRWIADYNDFNDAIKKGREPVIVKTEDTFFEKKLQGYFVEEEVMEKTVQKDASGEILSTIEHKRVNKRYIPPDTTAMIFYLKCRKGDIYNDKLKLTVENKNGQLAELIAGLKDNDIYSKAASNDAVMADE